MKNDTTRYWNAAGCSYLFQVTWWHIKSLDPGATNCVGYVVSINYCIASHAILSRQIKSRKNSAEVSINSVSKRRRGECKTSNCHKRRNEGNARSMYHAACKAGHRPGSGEFTAHGLLVVVAKNDACGNFFPVQPTHDDRNDNGQWKASRHAVPDQLLTRESQPSKAKPS